VPVLVGVCDFALSDRCAVVVVAVGAGVAGAGVAGAGVAGAGVAGAAGAWLDGPVVWHAPALANIAHSSSFENDEVMSWYKWLAAASLPAFF